MWNSIVSVPDHCFFIYFERLFQSFIADTINYNVSLKKLLQQCISESEFYGDLVYRFRKIVEKSYFSEQFRKSVNNCYRSIGYNLDIMRQIACQVVSSIMADSYSPVFLRAPRRRWSV